VKHFIYEAPEDIKNNLDLFLEYLQEKAPKTFNNIKDFSLKFKLYQLNSKFDFIIDVESNVPNF